MTWQAQQSSLLADELEAVLKSVAEDAGDLQNLVRAPLGVVRRGLSNKAASDIPWPLLPMMVCQAISGQYRQAVPAAAALQLLFAAGDVFDDIEDTGKSKSLLLECSPDIATNTATLLLVLAESAITRLRNTGVEDSVIVNVMRSLNSYYTTACIGQHLDLSAVQEELLSENEYLRIIDMKSASQIECACHVGALVATDKADLISAFDAFGHNLGMASQIMNDILGIESEDDILQRKKTLPVIYSLTQTDGETRCQLENAFCPDSQNVPKDIAQTKDLIYNCGAIYYSTIQVELYKQSALKALCQAASSGAEVEKLKIFLG
jgi:geranylgeranyl pyrophosphate synthase